MFCPSLSIKSCENPTALLRANLSFFHDTLYECQKKKASRLNVFSRIFSCVCKIQEYKGRRSDAAEEEVEEEGNKEEKKLKQSTREERCCVKPGATDWYRPLNALGVVTFTI